MLRCEIHDGDTEWEYEWKSPHDTFRNNSEYRISQVSPHHSGNYSCRGNMRNAQNISTEWSADITVTVYCKFDPIQFYTENIKCSRKYIFVNTYLESISRLH